MGRNGLNTKIDRKKLSAYLSLADQFHDDAEKFSPERRSYSKSLKSAAKEFDKALEAQDFDAVLRLEKAAQRFDLRFAPSEISTDMRLQSLTALHDATRSWEAGKDPAKVRRRFEEAFDEVEGFRLDSRRMKDPGMEAFVRTQCRHLGVFVGGTAVPAEKFYYNKRQECLRALQKEHQSHLDQALGFSPSKRKERGR